MPDVRVALTVTEAAESCGLSETTINRAVRAGELAAKNVSRGDQRLHVRITPADLRAWFDNLPDA